jgi:Ca-activated chloride channel family protein
MKLVSCVLFTASALIAPWYARAAQTTTAPVTGASTLIVLDASGSMAERIEGETKMDIAKRAVRELVASLPDDARLGLVVYGHRKPVDCNDIELLIPPARLNRAAFIAAVNAIKPKGRTPLSAALEFAARALDYTNQAANVILVSDGLETCNQDPCATAARLKAAGVNFVVHAVAFDLSARDAKKLACIATATGGRFLQANDAASLKDALYVAVTEASVATPTKPISPPPEVITPVTIKAAPSVLVGAAFPVGWTGPDNAGDYLTIVPKGTPDGDDGNLAYTRQGSPLQLTALVDPGDAELRYVAGRSHTVLARASIKLTEAEVTLTAAAEATAGAPVSIIWKGPNNQGDYLTIVPKTTEDGGYAECGNTSAGSPAKIAAPMETGEGEIRYMSGQSRRVLGRRPIKILPAKVTLAARDEVVAGAVVEITWTGPNNQNDCLTVVAKTVPDGSRGAIAYTAQGSPLKVTAPGEVGAGEIRYMSGQGDLVLARRAITMVAAQVTLTAPDEAVAGSAVRIAWTGPNNQNDYLTIVGKAVPDEERGAIAYTQTGSPLKVTAPGEPGPGEIRYVRGLDHQVLARRPITMVAAQVTLTAPDEAVAGSAVGITWTGPNNQNDYLTIVGKAVPDGERGAIAYTGSGSPLKVTAPVEPGPGEVRYMSGQDDQVLARRPITMVAAQVTVNARAEAVAGSAVGITWTGPNNQNDYLTIVLKATSDGERGAIAYTAQGSPLTVTAPAEPGPGEIRYVRGLDDQVLARRPITIVAAQVTLNAPNEAAVGSEVRITWTGPNNQNDYLTIVGKAEPDGSHGAIVYTGNGSPRPVTAPAEPGPCEIRYMSGQNDKVLARIPIKITAAP